MYNRRNKITPKKIIPVKEQERISAERAKNYKRPRKEIIKENIEKFIWISIGIIFNVLAGAVIIFGITYAITRFGWTLGILICVGHAVVSIAIGCGILCLCVALLERAFKSF